MKEIKTEVIIIGGGISGLWLLNHLKAKHIPALLLEPGQLGQGQTIASQGIIHGGLKYALKGQTSSATQTVQDMPALWARALKGEGPVSLQETQVLSPSQYLFSSTSLSSKIANFLASQALKTPAHRLKASDYPSLLQNPQFKGQVYGLPEMVLDVPSLVTNLAQNTHKQLIAVENLQADFGSGGITSLKASVAENERVFKAKHYVFTSGSFNAVLTQNLKEAAPMQTRPLHMVLVRHPFGAFYGHCLDAKMVPRLTISSHQVQNHKATWYLGGHLAETGVGLNWSQQLSRTQDELSHLFPWLDWTQAEFAGFEITRAENDNRGKRPDKPFVACHGNTLICWPTKLALAPLLTDEILHQLGELTSSADPEFDLAWPKPIVAKTPWEALFPDA